MASGQSQLFNPVGIIRLDNN